MRTSEILDHLIVPGSEAVIVGPSASPIMGVVELYTAVCIRNQGIVYIADPNYSSFRSAAWDRSGPVVSFGSVEHYLHGINTLMDAGMNLPDHRYLGSESGIFYVPAAGVAAVVDHNTSVFVRDNSPHGLDDDDFFRRVVAAYADALARGGVLIWQFDPDQLMEPDLMTRTLIEALCWGGFADVAYREVNDSVNMPIPAELRRKGVSYYFSCTGETFWLGGKGKEYQLLVPTTHKSDTMLTARKA